MVPGKKANQKSKTWAKKTSENYSAPFFLGAFAPPSELFCATKSFSASAAVGTCYLGITFLKPRLVDRLVFKARLRHEFRASLDMNVTNYMNQGFFGVSEGTNSTTGNIQWLLRLHSRCKAGMFLWLRMQRPRVFTHEEMLESWGSQAGAASFVSRCMTWNITVVSRSYWGYMMYVCIYIYIQWYVLYIYMYYLNQHKRYNPRVIAIWQAASAASASQVFSGTRWRQCQEVFAHQCGQVRPATWDG